VLNAYIDQHRDAYGVEPICKVLQVAPSAYRRHAARQRDPGLRGTRAKRDAMLMQEIARVWQTKRVYCARSSLRQRLAINGLYKAEIIHRRGPWKTRESVEPATLEWVAWHNHDRLMQPLGYIPPAEADANYYRQLASQVPMAV
jgi:hypothetical protein